ncbi:hypothetical protein [Desulforamulus putei]|uniref:hypothetical protein n=1 Tax=Desulforamulus putei TaxID=74701 RepID=UPI002FDDEE7C
MLEPWRISHWQATAMVMIVYATSILFVPGIVAKGAGMSSWMSLFIALAFGLLVAVLSSSLGLKVSR